MLNNEAQALSSITEQCYQNHGIDETAISFSGGKDSLVVLDLAVRVGIKKAVFCDTTVDFDETIHYVEKIRDFYGIDLRIVRSRLEFFESVESIGLPSRRARWCCDVFKFAPITKYAREFGIKVFVTGLRRSESKSRRFYSEIDKNPLLPFVQFNPILEWQDDEVWKYIKTYNLPYNPLYDIGFSRIGCWCCPYKTDTDWKLLERIFPEKMAFLEQILSNRSNKLKIRNKEQFVGERGWASWISPNRKISVGKIESCQNNTLTDFDVYYVEFERANDERMKKVERLLPMLIEVFWKIENGKMKIWIEKSKRNKLRILIEKAINCVSCGVCTSLCPTGALKVDDLSVYVDETLCSGCGKCMNASRRQLRGACIVRNYSNKAATITDLRKQTARTDSHLIS
jgi:phosphoadenosine phosphosulfate reductase